MFWKVRAIIMKKNKLDKVIILLLLVFNLVGCNMVGVKDNVSESGSGEKYTSEIETNSDIHSEPESETDTELDTESESETDTELETGTEPDNNTEPDEKPARPSMDKVGSFTDEELLWFNEQFFNVDENAIVNAFLNCTYSDVKDINIVDLFYDFSEDISEQEEATLSGSEIDFETDYQKLTVTFMDNYLRTYANISFEESNKVDVELYLYLEEFDAYYYSHGDVHHSPVEVISGECNNDGTIVLVCYRIEDEQNYQVTLTSHENGYYFVSNVLAE